MKTIGEVRRANLARLRGNYATWAALNVALGRIRRDATLGQIWNRNKDSKTGKPREMGTPLARDIEARLGLEEGWMDVDRGDVGSTPKSAAGSIPVVGSIRAGPDGFYEELGHPVGNGEQTLNRFSADDNAYALRVVGDSMRPKYEPGDFIIVEPNQKARPGNVVVVKLRNGQKMLKKLLYERDDEITLGSVNEDYRTMTVQRHDLDDALQYVGGSVSGDSRTAREPDPG